MELLPVEIWTLVGERLSTEEIKAMGVVGKYLHSAVMPLLQGCRLLQTVIRRLELISVVLFRSVRSVNFRVHDAHHMSVLNYAVLKGYEEIY